MKIIKVQLNILTDFEFNHNSIQILLHVKNENENEKFN